MKAASCPRLFAVAAPFGLSLVLLACAARAKVEARAAWSADPAEPAGEEGGPGGADDVEIDPLTDPAGAENATLVGVRHDLAIREEGGTAKCSCLAVALGRPDDPKFAWQAGAPKTAPGTVAIAVRALGTSSCPDAEASKGRASISAVLRSGKDVFVEIEEVPESRPLASGALFEGPEPGGAVFVRPKGKGVPYGRTPGASGPCRVR